MADARDKSKAVITKKRIASILPHSSKPCISSPHIFSSESTLTPRISVDAETSQRDACAVMERPWTSDEAFQYGQATATMLIGQNTKSIT